MGFKTARVSGHARTCFANLHYPPAIVNGGGSARRRARCDPSDRLGSHISGSIYYLPGSLIY
jgi:hypothetical protein